MARTHMMGRTAPGNGDDEALRRAVEAHLQWDSRIDESDIEVSVAQGHVRLDGSVPSLRAMGAAQDAILTIPGVRSLESRLRVEHPHIPPPSDEQIATSIQSAIFWNPDIDAADLEIDVARGEVVLRGTVDSLWKKMLADDDARGVLGVRSVTNLIEVEPLAQPIDEIIAEDIADAMERDARVKAASVDVEVRAGEVTLSGEVPDWASKRSAVEIACCTSGVVGVQDNLSVSS